MTKFLQTLNKSNDPLLVLVRIKYEISCRRYKAYLSLSCNYGLLTLNSFCEKLEDYLSYLILYGYGVVEPRARYCKHSSS